MKLPPVIGVAGYAKVGKDEVCAALAEYGYVTTRFSTELKEEVIRCYPILLALIAEQEGLDPTLDGIRYMVYVLKPPLVRALLQEHGSEVRRGDDIDYWVKKWKASVDVASGTLYSVADVRFPNESAIVHMLGGVIWRVHRPGVGPTNGHQSEDQAFPADAEINNDGTLEDLANRIRTLLEVE